LRSTQWYLQCMSISRRTGLVIGVVVVVAAIVGVMIWLWSTQAPTLPRPAPKTVEVVIPEKAYLPPEGWREGFSFQRKILFTKHGDDSSGGHGGMGQQGFHGTHSNPVQSP